MIKSYLIRIVIQLQLFVLVLVIIGHNIYTIQSLLLSSSSLSSSSNVLLISPLTNNKQQPQKQKHVSTSTQQQQQQHSYYQTRLYNDKNKNVDNENNNQNSRRNIIKWTTTKLLTSSIFVSLINTNAVQAVVMEQQNKDNNIFTTVGGTTNLSTDVLKERFVQAMTTIDILLKDYDTICTNGGGDNVRRYLGTVGTTSSLYGIMKVLKKLSPIANDFVNYNENMEDFDYWYQAAETSAYSSIFVEFSTAKSKPEQLLVESKIAIQHMKDSIYQMSLELNL